MHAHTHIHTPTPPCTWLVTSWFTAYQSLQDFLCLLFSFFFLIFIYGHAGFSLVAVCWFSLSSCGARAPGHVGSVVVALELSCASSVVVVCGLSRPVACGILVPWPGIKSVSPALEGGFFITGPPGKSLFAVSPVRNPPLSISLSKSYLVIKTQPRYLLSSSFFFF